MKGGLLAIVSHPDDETFGCGGTLALHAENGYPVSVLSLTCSPEERRSELIKATEALGLEEPLIFDGDRVTNDKSLVRLVSDVIVSKRPEIVITHLPFDYHSEHRLAFELVKEAIEWAAHTTTYNQPWTVERLLLMEVNTLIPTPHIIVDISDVFHKKKEAIRCYTSQLAKFSWGYYKKFNKRKAELRGIQGSCQYAEAFIEESLAKNSPFFTNRSTRNLFKKSG